ncbi:hypothetical protein L1887_14356 [Cichorium endivia]|nr:hypothetical protein L1887_14356 [Cichorium endivia]
MERGNYFASSSIPDRPERKVIEKNRRNKMKFLYFQLFSLLPENVVSKGCPQMSDRVNEVIQYIEILKTNLEKSNDKKEKLLSSKKLREYTTSDSQRASTSQSVDIQIHEMIPDVDVVLISGLNNYSGFCDSVRVLDQHSKEVVYANFCNCGPSTFHVHHKKIAAAEIYRRLNEIFGGSSIKEVPGIHAPPANEEDANFDLWDFEISSDVWFKSS